MEHTKDANEMLFHEHREGNRLVIGLLTGAAIGVGVGLLLAPRKGSDLRRQVRNQLTHMKEATSTGYHRARDTAGDVAHRGRGMYDRTRETLSHSAHEAQQYLKELTDALTRKQRQLEQVQQKLAR